ncbi:site-specific DNA-methyltransferase [Halobacillus trueperi]|uniref:Site-specific DNA-methyltransferase n=1 Tax=Halobacillus trueperi TaxID=156205 RepID=A0A3D8VE36_9BACI|nr:site-specific DNA-methyltransferase [Halobacillus trueperi]RDY67653.1 site-specific DNA-methyltransferase [Halobacillus trueperi]
MPILNFKGKSFVQNHHLSVKHHELVPEQGKSLTPKVSLEDNLIVHGDNLASLKALLPTYGGRIKCIYIDPPYNTGSEEWVYNDNVNSPMIKSWLGKVVDKEDMSRHDKWLCMMMPRIKLLKELLAEDGVIFISIDDNEFHHLKMLLDEIFIAEHNFIADLVWDLGTGTQAGHFTRAHEYVIAYAKSKSSLPNFSGGEGVIDHSALKKISKKNPSSSFTFPAGTRFDAEDGTELTGEWGGSEKTKILEGRMISKEGELKEEVVLEAGWAMKKQMEQWFSNEETVDSKGQRIIGFYFNSNGILRYQKERSILNPPTVLKELGSTKTGSRTLEEIFGDETTISFPKPVSLVKYLIDLVCDKNDIVLDSFAGSGTTGQAVLELNKEDQGNRRFILVEMEDYAEKITAERIRRVINGVPNSKNENLKDGLGGTYSYFSLGDALELNNILTGNKLPTYEDLARFVFFTATGEQFDPSKIDTGTNYIGSSKEYDVFLFYRPDIEYLRTMALNLELAESLPQKASNKRLVFAPTKYLDQEYLDRFNIDFSQIPFEILRGEA